MTEGGMSPREKARGLLCAILKQPECLTTMPVADLDLGIRVARRQRLLGTLALRLQRSGQFNSLPIVARDQLQSALVLAESRARLALWELDRIALALTDSSATRCIAMKGCAYLLLGLPHARGRIFADVDLMLPEAELEEVERHLNERGWRSRELTPYDDNYYRKWTHELPPLVHASREVEIDLHHNVLPRTARLKPDSGELLRRAQPVPGSTYWLLSNEDIALHAITHLMFNDDLADKLRDLVDIDELLRYFSEVDEAFWGNLVERAETLDLKRAAFYGLRYARRFLDSPIPDSVIDSTRSWRPMAPALWLMDRLVPHALFSQHPEYSSRVTDLSRLLLYMRSHWIRMPPWLLVYHLAYKFYAKRFRGGGHAA